MARLLKLPEVAQRLEVSEKTARRYVKAGLLPSTFVGNAYRVNEEDVEEYLRRARVEVGGNIPKGQAPLPLELEERRGASEEGRYLSALLDPHTKELRRISENYGPYLRLLPPAPSPEEMQQFSWVAEFLRVCTLMDRMVSDPDFSAVVGPWLSRVNDETLPADLCQKLRDFDAASAELFDEVEPIAEAWLASQRERLPDEWLAKWTAEFGHSSRDPAERSRRSQAAALPDEERRAQRYLRVSQEFAAKKDKVWTLKVEKGSFSEKEFEYGINNFNDFDGAFVEAVGTDLLGALRRGEVVLPTAEQEALDRARASIDAWHRTMWRAYEGLGIRALDMYRKHLERTRPEEAGEEVRNQSSA